MKNLLILSFFVSLPALAAKTDISASDLDRLRSGEIIREVEELKGEIWPKVTIKALIPNSPKENMDVFDNFETQKDYIPDMIKSEIVEKISDNKYAVAFEMKMPWPISNTEYVSENTIKQDGNDYRVDWKLIKSNQMKDTKGSVVFEAFEDKTLFTYVNHITPDSKFASMFKGRVPDDVEKTVKVIIKHLDKNIKK